MSPNDTQAGYNDGRPGPGEMAPAEAVAEVWRKLDRKVLLASDLEAVARFVEALAVRRAKCFLCKWILEDMLENGWPTWNPKDLNGQSIFPLEGKKRHVELEGIWTDALQCVFKPLQERIEGGPR